jgi:hypothetical protein
VPREHGVDALQRPTVRRGQSGQDDVVLHIEAAEDAPILVDQLHARLRDDVALLAGDFGAVEQDRAGAWRHHAHQALQRRALAGAVAAQQRHHLVALHIERNIEQDVRVPVIAVQAFDFEQAHAATTPPR